MSQFRAIVSGRVRGVRFRAAAVSVARWPGFGCVLWLTCLAGAPALAQTPGHGTRFSQHAELPDDVLLGLQIAVTIEETVGLADDPEALARVNRIGYRVAAAGGDTTVPYSFDVIDLPEPNALALPGGFIFVTRGILDLDLSDEELAHLLGHEIGHVHRHHFARAAQLNTLLALVQSALVVGILVGGSGEGLARQRVEQVDDPGRSDWAVGVTGRDALLEGTALFGSALQALFARSYSRKLEFEADETGGRLAVRAGFDPRGGPALLNRLHERSFEGQRFGYWRTHPYFADRIARVQAASERAVLPREPADDAAHRERLALFFARAAEHMPGEKEALCLYRRALRCESQGLASLSAALEMLRFKTRREEQKHPLLQRLRALVVDYDSLLARAERAHPEWEHLGPARAARDKLEAQRESLRGDYLRAIERDGVSTALLERFAADYPDDPHSAAVGIRLATHYHLTDRPELAVSVLDPLLRGTAGDAADPGAWADSAAHLLPALIAEMGDLGALYEAILDWERSDLEAPAALVVSAARQRLDQLLDADVSLESGGEFLRRHPDTPWSARLRERVTAQAQGTFVAGRVNEGLKRYQEALDAYFSVLAYAPESPAAAQAQEAIDRINRLEGMDMP